MWDRVSKRTRRTQLLGLPCLSLSLPCSASMYRKSNTSWLKGRVRLGGGDGASEMLGKHRFSGTYAKSKSISMWILGLVFGRVRPAPTCKAKTQRKLKENKCSIYFLSSDLILYQRNLLNNGGRSWVFVFFQFLHQFNYLRYRANKAIVEGFLNLGYESTITI